MTNNQPKSNRGGYRPGAGRKKGVPNKATADVMALAQVYTATAVQVLADIMVNGDSSAARVAAADKLLDRGHGKPKQTLDATVTDERNVVRMPQKVDTAEEWSATRGLPH